MQNWIYTASYFAKNQQWLSHLFDSWTALSGFFTLILRKKNKAVVAITTNCKVSNEWFVLGINTLICRCLSGCSKVAIKKR